MNPITTFSCTIRDSGKSEHLSKGARLSDPTVHPDGNRAAVLIREDGVLNLMMLDIKKAKDEPVRDAGSPSLTRLTRFDRGEQIYTPAWHPEGKYLYYAWARDAHREIRLFDLESGRESTIFRHDAADFRDPHVSSDGKKHCISAQTSTVFTISMPWICVPDP